MQSAKWLCGALVSVSMMVQVVCAHPGHGVFRSPAARVESVAGESTRSAAVSVVDGAPRRTFVMAREGMVQFRHADDSLESVPLVELDRDERSYVQQRLSQIRTAVSTLDVMAQATQRGESPRAQAIPTAASHFLPFVQRKSITTRWDERFLYVESKGIPSHPMMVGITAWQQQVPVPQAYTGTNAWRIPLHPIPAKEPATTKNRFLRGAIALAVNGIPIFNPLNNRGDDAYLFGELDEYGGHCGRADDYHYHIAPIHLQEFVGKDQPIAYALDGYPIYGYQDEKSPDYAPLDKLNGHKDKNGRYHYHATKTYPYLNGGFYGEVVERDGQVDPQPRAEPLRPALPPLRDARITKFQELAPGQFQLIYDVKGKTGTVRYTLTESGAATFEFVDVNGRKTTESYTQRRRGPGGGNPPPPRTEDRPRPQEGKPQPKDERTSVRSPSTSQPSANRARLEITSSSVSALGMLSMDCTCDGKKQSPAVSWKGAPAGTKAFAVSLWHTAPDQEKSYWLIYNIPATSQGFAQNSRPVGSVGMNDRRKPEYDPMCSKGPGRKTYHITVFALSQPISLPAEKVNRATLLAAVKDITLAEGTLDFHYERRGP
jgi:phosphatidylethanolamine-binding protein (PEBP) family uncharacterized protein